MEYLGNVYFLYQYSLNFFLQTVHNVLHNKTDDELKDKEDTRERISIITLKLFQNIFANTARGMLGKDHIAFAMRLAQVFFYIYLFIICLFFLFCVEQGTKNKGGSSICF